MAPRTEPVVLVHGFATSTELTWRQNGWLDLIADAGRTAVGIDLPGHGTRPRSHEPADYADAFDVVAADIPEGPVDAIGYSQGSAVLLRLAARDPDRFRRIAVTGAGQSVFTRSPGSEILAAALAGQDMDVPADERVILDHFVTMGRDHGNDPLALAAFLRRPYDPIEPSELATVTASVRVIIGEADFAGPAEPLVEALPDAELVVVPRVDHFNAPKDFSVIDAALEWIEARPF